MRAAVNAIALPLIRLRASGIRLLKPPARGTERNHLILLDPGLVAFAGHHFEWNYFMRRELSEHFDVSVYANMRARHRVISLLDAHPIFEDSIYPEYRGRDFRSVHCAMTRGMINSLRRIDRRHLSSRTVAVMHTLTVFQLSGIAEWYLGLPASQRPKLLLLFQFPLEFLVHPASEEARATSLAQRAVGALSELPSVRFACNSDALAKQLHQRLGVRCAVLPLPIDWPNRLDSFPPPPSRPVFGFFGPLRAEKGARLLMEAIPPVAARFPDMRFIVHAPLRASDESVVDALEKVPGVELLRKSFDTKDAYFADFCRAACILLPYDPSAYRHRTSGVLIEALGTRRLVVTTKGTWMEDELHKRGIGGVLMSEFTAAELARCLSEARAHLLSGLARASGLDPTITTANNPAAFCASIAAVFQ